MKRRKPPVVLASLMVVFAAVAVIVILPKGTADDGHGHDKPPTQEEMMPTGAGRPTPSKDDLKARLNSTTNEGPPRPDSPPSPGANELKQNPKSATIFLPRFQPHKPQPNDASISGQWYREGARASDPTKVKSK